MEDRLRRDRLRRDRLKRDRLRRDRLRRDRLRRELTSSEVILDLISINLGRACLLLPHATTSPRPDHSHKQQSKPTK
jgi:hypothetical protein